MIKSQLRSIYVRKRNLLSVRETAALSGDIAARFFGTVDLSEVKRLHTFIRIRKFNEIDTSLIYYKIWRDHPLIHTFAPRINGSTREIESLEFDSQTDLIESRWGIREPKGSELVSPDEIDLVIVPLLCFDKRGHRVGYGKGFYDRFLRKCRPDCLKAGLSFFPPINVIDDIGESDVPLDLCITPRRLYNFVNQ